MTVRSGRNEINPKYISDFNRVCTSLEVRCKIKNRPPDLSLLHSQVALRAAVLGKATVRREISALRAVLEHRHETGHWASGVDPKPWLEHPGADDVSHALAEMRNTAAHFISTGPGLLASMVDELINDGYPGSEEDISRVITGTRLSTARERQRERKGLEPISEMDLERIDLDLITHPHETVIHLIAEQHTDLKAMLRVFSRAIWLTGMRPVEVFSCRMMVGNRDHVYSDAERNIIRKHPTRAALSKLLVPQETIISDDPSRYGKAVLESMSITGIDPVLLIRNAKTTNSNSKVKRKWRAMTLCGMDEENLNVLCIAAHIHQAGFSRGRQQNLVASMSRILGRMSETLLPERANPITLYDLRHDFATRARRRMGLHQAAALMGHTARASTMGYGKAWTRRSRSGGPGWLPYYDSEIAESLLQHWDMTKDDLVPGDQLDELKQGREN